MAINDETLWNLASQVAKYAANQRPGDAKRQRLIVPERLRDPAALSEAQRAAKVRQVQFVVGRYSIPWLVDPIAKGRPLEDLSDADLERVYVKAGQALRCVQDGVSFDDAGLVEWAD